MTSKRVDQLIDSLPQLQGLSRQVRRLQALQSALATVLPDNLAASTAVVFSADGEVTLFADNGAVAAKLRQMTPRILMFFRQRGVEVTGIRVQVQVRTRHNSLPRKQISLGPGAREAILELAAKLEASPLKSALVKFSHRKPTSSNCDD